MLSRPQSPRSSSPGPEPEPAPEELTTDDFDYSLDEGLIAQHPAARRDESRLLIVDRARVTLEDSRFRRIEGLIPAGDVLVLNDTRVLAARLLGRKPTGARAEILLVRAISPDRRRWRALVRPGGKLKPGRRVEIGEDLSVAIEATVEGGARIVRLDSPLSPVEVLERYGRIPLPPYIARSDEESDRTRYQTVYARREGSVAAPTAGLHFTHRTLERLKRRGVQLAWVTLHVGPGTFRLVEERDPACHDLEAEPYSVPEETVARIRAARERGNEVWAVGTTVVRTLESVAMSDGSRSGVEAGEGWTDLFIRPPYRFRVVDHLLTNFHLPRSPLLMLVAAFAGYDLTMEAYRHAVDRGYRFYSYGDAMLVI